MKIAVVGAGRVGRALAQGLTGAGHSVAVAVRDPGSAGACSAAAAGLPVLPISWAVDGADVIVLAVPHGAITEVSETIGETDTLMIDASNNLVGSPDGPIAAGPTGAGLLQQERPEARIVKIFDTIGWDHLSGASFPAPGAAMLLCGTGPDERAIASQLARDLGFKPVDVGGLSYAPALEHLASLWVRLSLDRGRGFAFGIVSDSAE
ncbi:NAD(P)-binding domain-containing protein, partial [bacterium]|nr:NAD(P)-binding domain-containing protein [bacterium]